MKVTSITLGSIIFLNGPSSAGKSTLSAFLQEKISVPYLHIGIDKVIGMMPPKLNDWTGGKKDQGFWWEQGIDEEGHKIAHVQAGPYAKRISDLLREIVLTMVKNGHNVIVDEVSFDSYKKWQEILVPFKVLYVGVKADTKTLKYREKERGDRMIGGARAQNAIVHKDKTYDLEIWTDQISLEEAAQKIIEAVKEKGGNLQ